MNEDLEQQRGEGPGQDAQIPPAELAEWIPFGIPSDAHPAAFEAWLHTRTGCRLVKVWGAYDHSRRYYAGDGEWRYVVIHPRGPKRLAWQTSSLGPLDLSAVLQSATSAALDCVKDLEQQQLGG